MHRGLFTLDSKPIPGLKYNPMMLLHGEEKVLFSKPLSTGETYIMHEEITDISDKKSGGLIVLQTKVYEKSTNDQVALVESNIFIRGIGGFGYKGTLRENLSRPKTPSEASVEAPMAPNAAFLYRMNGDRNPLHVDPKMAKIGKFDRPILHGLCTYAMSVRAVQKKYSNDDPNALESVNARFTSHVFPGETLIVDMWKEGNKITFMTKTKERGKVACIGYVKIKPQAKL